MADRNDKRPDGEIDPDAPASEEEVLASSRLRDALAGKPGLGDLREPVSDESRGLGDAATDRSLELIDSLRSAWSPEELAAGDHAEIVDDLPTAEELALAAELRDALAATGAAPDVVVALRSAWNPAPLDDAEHRAIVARAVGRAKTDNVVAFRPRRVAVATITTVLALAASIVVWVTTTASQAEAPLARVRSTQPLFDEPFKAGETSARIDRIAIARAADYRDNRFAKWGVR